MALVDVDITPEELFTARIIIANARTWREAGAVVGPWGPNQPEWDDACALKICVALSKLSSSICKRDWVASTLPQPQGETTMGSDEPDFASYATRLCVGVAWETKLKVLEELYNEGFDDGRDSMAQQPQQPLDSPCYCADCGELFFKSALQCDLAGVRDLGQRLDPGSEVPVGECPKCGALAYLAKRGEYDKVDVDWLREHVAKGIAEKYGLGLETDKLAVMTMLTSADPHTHVAAFMCNCKPIEVCESDRAQAKTELYMLCYGGD